MNLFAPLLLALGLPSLALAQNEWRTYQANPRHDGVVDVAIDPTRLTLMWSRDLRTSLQAPAIGGSTVFVSGGDKTVRAIDAATGTELWARGFASANSLNPPAYADGRVYFQTGNHSTDTWLRCLDARTGEQVFQAPHEAQWERYLNPTIVDGVVYVNGGYYGGMYAFDAMTGQRAWFRALAQYDAWTPAVDATHAYTYVGGTLNAVHRATGAVSWSVQDPSWSWAGYAMNLAPVLGGQDDIFLIHGRRLVRFDLPGRTIHWQIADNFAGQPAVRDGVIYAINSGIVQARSQAKGALLWGWGDARDNLIGEVVLTRNHLLVHSSTRTYLVDLATHSLAWSAEFGGHVAVAHGSIYVAESQGTRLHRFRFVDMPEVQSVTPARAHYARPRATVTLRGLGFSQGAAPQVRIGGRDATEVVVVNDQTITCTVPGQDPGWFDIEVENDIGRRTLTDGFVYYPAIRHAGEQRIGTPLSTTFLCDPGDEVLGLVGHVPPRHTPVPPFQGALGLDRPLMFVAIPRALFDGFRVTIDVPNDPGLRNGRLGFQALVGPDLMSGQGAFSNATTITLR